MNESTALHNALQAHLPIHRARARFIAAFVLALIRVRTTDLAKVALALNPAVLAASNYRRIQRVLAGFALDQTLIARLIVHLVPCPPEGHTLSLDRTEWSVGRAHTRVLMVALEFGTLALPLAWAVAPGRGNTALEVRERVLERLFAVIAPEQVRCLLADREFVGGPWFTRLHRRRVPFVIRMKHNAVVPTHNGWRDVAHYFRALPPEQPRLLKHRRTIYGHKLYVAGMWLRQKRDQYLIVVSNRRFQGVLADPIGLYGQRWRIETLFGAMKSRGFDLEATHVCEPERSERLVGLVSVALAWVARVGEELAAQIPIAVKRHGRRVVSVFWYGLDHLRRLLPGRCHPTEFKRCLRVLSCT